MTEFVVTAYSTRFCIKKNMLVNVFVAIDRNIPTIAGYAGWGSSATFKKHEKSRSLEEILEVANNVQTEFNKL